MFGTVVAVVVLIVLVLPGFVTLRLAGGRRAQPAKLTDLELVLRALGYALVLHLAFALTGWTGCVVNAVDDSELAWTDHVPQLAAYVGAVFAAAAIVGGLLERLFGWLHPKLHTSGPAHFVFSLLGGVDVRDGFDFIFERRKGEEDFIVEVVVEGENGDDVRVGRYGKASFVGVSPQPHDLYLEERWEVGGDGELSKPAGNPVGVWFPFDSIKALRFRELPAADARAGRTPRLTLKDALRLNRLSIAEEIEQAVPHVVTDPNDKRGLVRDLRSQLRELAAALAQDEPKDDAYAAYEFWTATIRLQLIEAGAFAAALGAYQRADGTKWPLEPLSARDISANAAISQLRVPFGERNVWIVAAEHQRRRLEQDFSGFQGLIALIIDAITAVDGYEPPEPDDA